MTKIAHSRTRKLAPRPIPSSVFTHPAASIFTGKVDGKLPKMESLPFVKRKQPDRRKGGGYDYWAVNPNEASPQTDESCIVPSHSGWRGSLHRRIPNDGQITALLATVVLGPPRGIPPSRPPPPV